MCRFHREPNVHRPQAVFSPSATEDNLSKMHDVKMVGGRVSDCHCEPFTSCGC